MLSVVVTVNCKSVVSFLWILVSPLRQSRGVFAIKRLQLRPLELLLVAIALSLGFASLLAELAMLCNLDVVLSLLLRVGASTSSL